MEANNIPSSEDKGPTKSALKKQAKEQKKAEQKAARQQKQGTTTQQEVNTIDEAANNYGTLPLIQSVDRPGRVFTHVKDLDESKANQEVLIRGRIHLSRSKGNLCFLLIRQRIASVQAVLSKGKDISKQMLTFAASIPKESLVDIEAVVSVTKDKIEAATQQTVELMVKKIFVVSASVVNLPLLMEDASRPSSVLKAQDQAIKKIEAQIEEAQQQLKGQEATEEGKQIAAKIEQLLKGKAETQKYVKVKRETRLNNRVIDLRTQANQAIFRIQSAVCQLFREYLLNNQFVEIHSPKLIGGASEGGANVFKVQYFNGSAFLAQSPQLYKQMAICSDMERVFEIGPVFRAENANTHRHLTEFIGLDLEMAFNEHYHEVLDMLEGLFIFLFTGLETRYSKELEVIRQQYPFEPLKYKSPALRLRFAEGIALLKEAGVEVNDLEDLSTPNEKFLGKLVKEKYGVDFYMLDKFPTSARPFYTMPDPKDPNYTNSYDFFIRGEEIMSGSQRIHDPELLSQRATCLGIPISSIKDYIDSFRFGAPPHGGGGIGLERVVMLYLGFKNIRMTSMFPRDPSRLTP